jgi:hypothetical protein
MRTIRIALAGLLASVSTASAQTQPGLTFTIRTQLRNHQNVEKSRPDSVRIKRLAAEAAARADDITTGGDTPPGGGRAGGGNGAGGGAGTNNVLNMTGTAIKGWQRMDVKGVIGNPELQATQWALFTDTSSTVVEEVQKQFWPRVFDIGSILAFTSAVDNPNGRVGTLKVSWDSLPAETWEGRPAKHYQLKMQYGLGQPPREDSLKLLAITTVTSDYWVVDLPVNFENRFAGIGRPRRQIPDSLRGEWAKMLSLYEQLGKGTIVKFTATGTIGENANRATEYTRTMEMTGIKEQPVDPAIFRIPADYTLRPPPQRGRGGN